MSVEAIRRAAVVGARGEMGRVLCRASAAAGVEAVALNRPLTPEKLAAGVAGADVVVVSVPIAAFGPVVEEVAAHMDASQILADVCSVKTRPINQMLRAHPGPVVGTHPLFGGVLPEPEARRVALCRARGEAGAAAVRGWVEAMGFIPFDTTAEEHDQALGYIQGLNFVTTVSYLSCGAHQPGVEKFLTPSFRRRLDAARKMLTKDAEMFEAMFESNPASQDVVRRFRSHLNVAAGGDVSLLADRAGWWWRNGKNGGGA